MPYERMPNIECSGVGCQSDGVSPSPCIEWLIKYYIGDVHFDSGRPT